ncbi:MAG: c-type cytochrome [Geminicoccaceae bacterium]
MRRIGRPIVLPMALVLLAGAGAAQAQGDPENGEEVFGTCQACHAIDEEKNGVGPHLVGIFGREAGSVEGYNYSNALKSSEIAWEDDTIAAYVKEPKAYVPGTKMLPIGLDDEEIADLLAYLHEATGG